MTEEPHLAPAPARVVVAVVFDDVGRVLMVRRRKPEGSLSWSFPGGKAEPGETDAETAIREVREETGIACGPGLDLGERLHPVTGRIIAYRACEAIGARAELREPDRMSLVAWLTERQVLKRVGAGLYPPAAEEIAARTRLIAAVPGSSGFGP